MKVLKLERYLVKKEENFIWQWHETKLAFFMMFTIDRTIRKSKNLFRTQPEEEI